MAIFKDTQITKKGHRLLTKVLSNVCNMRFTKVQAGDGHFDYDTMDVFNLTSLINPRHDGKIVKVKPQGKFTQLECVLTNADLTSFLEFREPGVFAQDPDDGEILFAYTNAGEFADPIGPFNGIWLHEEQFTIDVYTANAANIVAVLTPTEFARLIEYDNALSRLLAVNIQDAIDELAASYPISGIFTHGLKMYPSVHVIEFDAGYGVAPYGTGPYGGSNGRQLRSRVEYLDRNRIKVLTEQDYGPVKNVAVTPENEYLVTFVNTTKALCIVLTGVTGYGGRPPTLPPPAVEHAAVLRAAGMEVNGLLQSADGNVEEMLLAEQ